MIKEGVQTEIETACASWDVPMFLTDQGCSRGSMKSSKALMSTKSASNMFKYIHPWLKKLKTRVLDADPQLVLL